jgi:4,5-dihydroxyphthalate decarboxylase
MKTAGNDLPITFAAALYDRLQALYTGEVRAEGIGLRFVINDEPRDIFNRMLARQEYDVAEMSTSDFIARRSVEGDRCPMVGLPVFPSRMFRHGFITCNAASGIRRPKDLEGRRIGVPRYSMTAAVWMRGLLQHDYGVDFSTVRWVEGAINKPGPHGDPPLLPLLREIPIEPNDPGKSLSDALEEGRIDALLGTQLPQAIHRNPAIRRLFPDYPEDEKSYFRRTGLFPMMHMVAIRRDVYEANPFVAKSLFRAFEESKQAALLHMRHQAALRYMLPWMTAEMEEMRKIFGEDPYPYGIEPNRPALETMMGYMVEQGIIAEPLPVERLFAPVD